MSFNQEETITSKKSSEQSPPYKGSRNALSPDHRINAIADIMAAITLRRMAKTQPAKQAAPELSGAAEVNKNE